MAPTKKPQIVRTVASERVSPNQWTEWSPCKIPNEKPCGYGSNIRKKGSEIEKRKVKLYFFI